MIGRVLEFTEWAREILAKSDQAARRFNPEVRVRLAVAGREVQALLTDRPEEGDREVVVDGATILVQAGLEGLVDCEEPHDRVVLRPAGSAPNRRGH